MLASFFKSYFMRVNIFHTLTLQPDFMFLLSMEMLGLHSPSRCWLFIILRFFSLGFIFHTLTPQAGCRLSLSMQMFGVHSPSTYQIFLCKFYFSWGLTSFIPSLSKQVVSSHSPSRCWLFQFFLFLMEFHIFYTNTLQAGLRFILSMEVLGLLSPRRCWPFQFIFIQS